MTTKSNNEAAINETVQTAAKAVKRGTLKAVIEDKILSDLMSGNIWEYTEDEIIAKVELAHKFQKLIAQAFKKFDKVLEECRQLNGSDYLKEAEYFRKPRSKKNNSDTNLLDELSMDDEEDSE
jgi:uncharacterized phage-like protein YoqJ